MAFVDELELHIQAGNGGDGVVRWRQEKFKPKGGPSGGNGGNGGNVIAAGVADLAYLDYYLHKRNFSAENGEPGGNNSKEGKNGEDLILKFPRGTVITNTITEESIEITDVDQEITLLKGGRGGLGNEHFKSSTNTTPYEWTPGTPGEEADFTIELRLFADIGFVGLPSAGKSTLLNALTNAKSKVGAYHFTTLDPHLGDMHGYILADIPGIIEGASHGKGLGHKFLRHIRRTKSLVHFIGLDSEDPIADYQVIRKELGDYDAELTAKDEIILLSKTDLIEAPELPAIITDIQSVAGHDRIYTMSAYDEDSIKAFKKVLTDYLEQK
ncbi:GTPase ObgE [Patescibacteria group bacterium]|nr:GTPase ObgE [Patescibacteria group bacterium]